MITYTTEIRVRFCETDKMQFLHHAKYVEYFECARTELLRHFGLPYDAIEKSGYEMPVMSIGVNYKHAAFYDEVILVEACVKQLYAAKVHIEYKAYKKETMQLCADGYTDLMFIKSSTKKAVKPPEFYLNAFKQYFETPEPAVVNE